MACPASFKTRDSSPAVAAIFPYVDRFDDLYMVRFPLVDAEGRSFLAPGPEPLRLEVKRALADCSLSWTLAE